MTNDVMTEDFWHVCTSTRPMLEFLKKSSSRKLRLFSCACYRRLWALSPPQEEKWDVLHTVERFADALVSKQELYRLRKLHPEERMAIANADEAARITTIYCLNQIWDLIGGDNHRQSDHRLYSQEPASQCRVLRDIFGNPYHPVSVEPSWLTTTVVELASQMYESRDFSPMPILADALQDAGCDNEDILNHCRQPCEHVRGCWGVDLILGKS